MNNGMTDKKKDYDNFEFLIQDRQNQNMVVE